MVKWCDTFIQVNVYVMIVDNCDKLNRNKRTDHGLRHQQLKGGGTIVGECIERHSERHPFRDDD